MGIIKQTSDNFIIDNVSELITPASVRQVNDVIDAQVVGIETSITTINESITTLSSNTIPTGGLEGQILAKRSNTDNDVEWIAPPSGGGNFLPLSGGAMTGAIDMQENIISNFKKLENTKVDGYSTTNMFFEVDEDEYDFIFGSTNTANFDFRNVAGVISRDSQGNIQGNADFYFGIYTKNKANNNYTSFNLNTNTYEDSEDKPLKYAADYSANYTARSLVDKGFFDGKVKLFKQTTSTPPNTTVPIEFAHPYGDDLPIYKLYKGTQEVSFTATLSTGSINFGNIGSGSYTLVAYFI
ncbi:hypothetical protein WAF17_02565 [Bernardetia sp. ABR2-2B]|uniref:hypothetical protein n=1 Tax=Bernardetia sp. ABR2-2B TaxID=3127472 RepID=UPI0030D33C9E